MIGVAVSLQEEIDERSREIHTDRYSMAINEAVAMYELNDLEVHPEFQRIFRWTIEQQSRLIESVFLGIPIPPIFVAQRTDGVWDVVDGVQRLSTLFRFMGVLKNEDRTLDPPVPLVEGEYLKGLEGVVWDSEGMKKDRKASLLELTDAQKRIFKRARLDFQIVQKESDEQAKFDLFQRLNSGTRLSEQEARNCLAVMLDSSFANWLRDLAIYPHYSNTVDISERKEQESYGVESVLRYLATSKGPIDRLFKMGDVGEFLTARMRDFITDEKFDRSHERELFEFVFDILDDALGENAFKRYDPAQKRFVGKFSISAFEAIASGIARNRKHWSRLASASRKSQLIENTKAVWLDPVFQERAGGGKPANRRIPYMVQVGNRIFAE